MKKGWIGALVLLLAAAATMAVLYVSSNNEQQRLREENARLQASLNQVQEELEKVQSVSEPVHAENEKLRSELEAMQSELDSAREALASAEGAPDGLIRSGADYFLELRGIDYRDVLADLASHPELIPYEGSLGGTMMWWPGASYVLNEKWVYGYFEDGHNSGNALLEFKIGEDRKIEWKVLAAILQGEQQ